MNLHPTRAAFIAAIALAAVTTFDPLPDARGQNAQTRRDVDGRTSAPAQVLEAYRHVATWVSDAGPWPKGFVRQPAGVAVDATGRVFVVDTRRSMVHVFGNGAWFDAWGGPGAAPGQLSQPHGIATMGSQLLVADTGNRRVQVFEADGRPVASWTGVGSPWDVAVTTDRVLVTDQAGDRVVVLDHAGRGLAALGGSGAAPGRLSGPTGLAAWPDGQMAVVDAGNNRVQVWASDGSPVRVMNNASSQPLIDVSAYGASHLLVASQRFLTDYDLSSPQPAPTAIGPTLGGFLGIAVAPDGASPITPTIWASVSSDDRTGLRRWQGGLGQTAVDWLGDASPPGELVGPRRIAAQGGDVLVADTLPRVQRFRSDGSPQEQLAIGLAGEVEPLADGLLAASGASLRRLVGPAEQWRWQPAAPRIWLGAVAVDPLAGRALALDVNQQAIHELDLADGTLVISRSLAASASGDYQALTDLAVRPDGGRLVVNRSAAELEWYDPSGALRERWPVDGTPLRVAAGADNAAYVLTREGWVWKLAADGALGAWWDAAPTSQGGRGAPADLAALADGRVLVADSQANEVRVYAPDPAAPPPTRPDTSACHFVHDKWASPPRIPLGESIGVSLTVQGQCVNDTGVDAMLVIDRSGSMAGRKIDAARSAAIAFLGEMRFDVSRVGLVVFNAQATQPISLTSVSGAVVDAIVGFGDAVGGTDIGEGIQLAASELITHSRAGIPRVIVMMTDGRPDGATVDADLAATAAKAAGIRLFSIGFGSDLDTALLQRIASSPADYFFAPTTTELSGIYTEIARRISSGSIPGTAVITDVVPANMTYVPGSAQPPVTSYRANTLRWEMKDMRGDQLFTYRLVPQEVGTWPTNVDARMRYDDGKGRGGELVFPVPRVEVWAPGPTALPPARIYLPLLLKEHCTPTAAIVDVALVIDTSSSMAGANLEAAKLAAHRFVAGLDLSRARAAIIGFNRTATLAEGLSADASALALAIDRLTVTPGTAIDAGITTATDELTGPRGRAGATRVLVLLSDGHNNAGPAPVRRAAAAAAAAGLAIYAVAFGEGADLGVLGDVAGAPERLFVALQPADLERIYAEIAGVIGCR